MDSIAETRPFDLARLVQERQAEVWRYLRYLGANGTESEDLTQETFLAVARSRFTEQSAQQTASYLRTVARRQLLMLRRKQRRRITTVELNAAEAAWADSMWPADAETDRFDDRVEAARGCVEKLDGRPREAIDLLYRQGTSRETIAEKLGMTADGVKTLLRRTRAKLRECIERTLQQPAT
ncbi:MAG: RNA polymerase sigma factor [Planctomycetota bacterium]